MSTGAATVTGMLVLLALVVVVWLLMLRGWRARVASQESPDGLALPEPPAVPERAMPDGPEQRVEGLYVSTTFADHPLDRVTAHGLGSRGVVVTHARPEGLVLERTGARSFLVPARDLVGVRRTRGQAGKYTLEKEGLVVITWRLGGVDLDTGVRTRRRADAAVLVEAVRAMAAR